MVQVNHNTEDHPAQTPFDPLPEGEYVVVLDKAERKNLRDPASGARLACEFTVIRGEYEGRKLFDGFNLWHVKDEPRQISERQFSSLINACGKLAVADTDELLHIPVVAVVKIRPASGGFDAQNQIKTYKLEDGTSPTPDVAKAASTTGKGPTRAPWSGKK